MPEDPTESSFGGRASLRSAGNDRPGEGVRREPRQYRADDPYAAYIGANPVQEILLSIATCAMDGTNGITCAYQVTLTFETLWFSRVIN